jgi:hypothetical protein
MTKVHVPSRTAVDVQQLPGKVASDPAILSVTSATAAARTAQPRPPTRSDLTGAIVIGHRSP